MDDPIVCRGVLVLVPSDQLLQDAQSIFGKSLVTQAWFGCNNNGKPLSSSFLKAQEHAKQYEPENTSISLPTHGIVVLEFQGNRKVSFSTSEWATIELPDKFLVEKREVQ